MPPSEFVKEARIHGVSNRGFAYRCAYCVESVFWKRKREHPVQTLLHEILTLIVKPETILEWFRQLVARKFDGSAMRVKSCGRPQVSPDLEELIVRLARENAGWGYDRIVGALSNFGIEVSDQTVGEERNHQGKGNVLLFPCKEPTANREISEIKCRQRLGGLLKYYYRDAA